MKRDIPARQILQEYDKFERVDVYAFPRDATDETPYITWVRGCSLHHAIREVSNVLRTGWLPVISKMLVAGDRPCKECSKVTYADAKRYECCMYRYFGVMEQ